MKTKDRIKTRSNKGITLIALVITVIVLLILAAVTINALSGDNGILKRAKDAKEQTNEKNQQEIFTYIQKQYPTHPDTINKSGYLVTIFKNPRTAATIGPLSSIVPRP